MDHQHDDLNAFIFQTVAEEPDFSLQQPYQTIDYVDPYTTGDLNDNALFATDATLDLNFSELPAMNEPYFGPLPTTVEHPQLLYGVDGVVETTEGEETMTGAPRQPAVVFNSKESSFDQLPVPAKGRLISQDQIKATQGKPKASTVKREAKKFRVATRHLHYADLDAARRVVSDRFAMETTEPDDVDLVKQHAAHYVGLMLEAFDLTEVRKPSEDFQLDSAQATYFQAWQTAQHNAVVKKLTIDLAHDAAYVEKRCWKVLQAVVDMHERGAIRIEDTNNTFKTDLRTKCSDRVAGIIKNLQAYTIVRLDIVKYTHIDQLVADPAAYMKRKLTNMAINHKKQDDKKRAKGRLAGHAAVSTEVEPATSRYAKPGATRKRARRGDCKFDTEDDDDEFVPGPARKRAKETPM